MDEDNLKDLFGSDSDKEDNEISTDEEDTWRERSTNGSEENRVCTICCRLRRITGEESDDAIYNIVWGICSDTTGLVQVIKDFNKDKSFAPLKCDGGTDSAVCNMDVSDEDNRTDIALKRQLHSSASHLEINQLNLSSRSTQSSIIVEKSVTKPVQSFRKKRIRNNLRYYLPDGSVLRINLKYVKSNKILNQFTFPDGDRQIVGLRVHVSEKDIETNPGLLINLLKCSINHKYPDTATETVSLNSNSDSNVNSTTSHTQSSELSDVGYNGGNDSIVEEQVDTAEKNVFLCCNIQPENSQPSTSVISADLNTCNPTLNKTVPKPITIRFFLPDGSFKRMPLAVIKTIKELQEFTKYSPDKVVREINHHVTAEDLRTNRALRDLFTDFLSSQTLSENSDNTDRPMSNISVDHSLHSVSNQFELRKSEIVSLNNSANPPTVHQQSSKFTDGDNIDGHDSSAEEVVSTGKSPENYQQNTSLKNTDTNMCNPSLNQVAAKTDCIDGHDLFFEKLAITAENRPKNNQLNKFVKNSDPEMSNSLNHSVNKTRPLVKRRTKPKRQIRLFLPDGSYKRVPLKCIQSNKELSEFTNYSPDKAIYELNQKVTVNDLRNYGTLQHLFSDFLLSSEILNEWSSMDHYLDRCSKSLDSQASETLASTNSPYNNASSPTLHPQLPKLSDVAHIGGNDLCLEEKLDTSEKDLFPSNSQSENNQPSSSVKHTDGNVCVNSLYQTDPQANQMKVHRGIKVSAVDQSYNSENDPNDKEHLVLGFSRNSLPEPQSKKPLTSHFQRKTSAPNRFGFNTDPSPDSVNDSLKKHLLEPGADSSILNLESHIKSSVVATVHSSADGRWQI